MGRMVDLDDLVSAGIIAGRLGMSRVQLLHDWMTRDPACPRPVRYISRTAVWLWPEMREWALDTGWQRWSERPVARRALIEPADLVPAELLLQRLGLNPKEVDLESDAQGLYRWSDAEERWHRRINTA
jgi:hypothetical protein